MAAISAGARVRGDGGTVTVGIVFGLRFLYLSMLTARSGRIAMSGTVEERNNRRASNAS